MKKAKALTTRSLVSDKLVATMKEIAKTASTNMLLKVRSPIVKRRTTTSSIRIVLHSTNINSITTFLLIVVTRPGAWLWLPAVRG